MPYDFIGFINEYEGYSCPEESLRRQLGHPRSPEEDSLILAYLTQRQVVLGWMHYFEDLDTGHLVAPHGYCTDGHWIWPDHFYYLLEKHSDYVISPKFLKHLRDRDFHYSLSSTYDEVEAANLLLAYKDARLTTMRHTSQTPINDQPPVPFVGFVADFLPPRSAPLPAIAQNLGTLRSQEENEKIIAYLEAGEIFTCVHCLYDRKTMEPIGVAKYMTDAHWIWPGYLIAILREHPDFQLPPAFLQHLRDRNFQFTLAPHFNPYKLGEAVARFENRL